MAAALDVVDTLLGHLRPALRATADRALVTEKPRARLLRRGTGADVQRDVYARTGDWSAVVHDAYD